MVAKIVLKKEETGDRTAKLTAISEKSEELKTLFAGLVDTDAAAFEPVAAAYGLPKATDEEKIARSAAVQAALRGACETSNRTVESSVELLGLAQQISGFGGSSIMCDVETAVHLGYCALRSAFANASSNVRGVKDTEFVQSRLEKLKESLRKGSEISEDTLSALTSRMRQSR
jgi:formiminotetrahydrofolate cyclodeaminase